MILILTILAVIGCGLMAGIFFAFSNSIMKAMSELPAPQGITAMQAVNRTILNSLFLGIFMGTAILSTFFTINGFVQWMAADSSWTIAGGLFYLAGSFLVTVIINVPLNNELMAAEPDAPESVELWNKFLSTWTTWNHIRTIASLGAVICFVISLL